uniref:Uncharacterized protein n=1 Tax=Phytophthora infestans TaxID=4787 RepID=Q572D7_PHYIN|nr:hypothetical protein PI35.0010 [Phytophthora infestans]CAI72341.1 hypothetical protein PI49.0490 [Phytophthora infestans]
MTRIGCARGCKANICCTEDGSVSMMLRNMRRSVRNPSVARVNTPTHTFYPSARHRCEAVDTYHRLRRSNRAMLISSAREVSFRVGSICRWSPQTSILCFEFPC